MTAAELGGELSADDDPFRYGRLLSPREAQQNLGIPASTVTTWHARRQRTGLHAAGQDCSRRPLFYEADLLALRHRMPVRDGQGRRLHTMTEVQQTIRSRSAGRVDHLISAV